MSEPLPYNDMTLYYLANPKKMSKHPKIPKKRAESKDADVDIDMEYIDAGDDKSLFDENDLNFTPPLDAEMEPPSPTFLDLDAPPSPPIILPQVKPTILLPDKPASPKRHVAPPTAPAKVIAKTIPKLIGKMPPKPHIEDSRGSSVSTGSSVSKTPVPHGPQRSRLNPYSGYKEGHGFFSKLMIQRENESKMSKYQESAEPERKIGGKLSKEEYANLVKAKKYFSDNKIYKQFTEESDPAEVSFENSRVEMEEKRTDWVEDKKNQIQSQVNFVDLIINGLPLPVHVPNLKAVTERHLVRKDYFFRKQYDLMAPKNERFSDMDFYKSLALAIVADLRVRNKDAESEPIYSGGFSRTPGGTGGGGKSNEPGFLGIIKNVLGLVGINASKIIEPETTTGKATSNSPHVEIKSSPSVNKDLDDIFKPFDVTPIKFTSRPPAKKPLITHAPNSTSTSSTSSTSSVSSSPTSKKSSGIDINKPPLADIA